MQPTTQQYLLCYSDHFPASTDYQLIDSSSLTFPAGSTAGHTLSLTVEIVDDALVEGSEQFSLTVSDSLPLVEPVSGQDLVTVAIIDNDFGKHTALSVV